MTYNYTTYTYPYNLWTTSTNTTTSTSNFDLYKYWQKSFCNETNMQKQQKVSITEEEIDKLLKDDDT